MIGDIKLGRTFTSLPLTTLESGSAFISQYFIVAARFVDVVARGEHDARGEEGSIQKWKSR